MPFDAHNRGRKGLTHVHAFKNAFVSRGWARDALCASPSLRSLSVAPAVPSWELCLPGTSGPDLHVFDLEFVIQEDF